MMWDPTCALTTCFPHRMLNVMDNVTVSIWYDFKDDGTDTEQGENNFGTLEEPYVNATMPHTPKPAFHAASTIQVKCASV